MNREGRRIPWLLLAAAGLVLFIACGNAAALLLVCGLQRQREYALRIALGVSRGGLFRQVPVECRRRARRRRSGVARCSQASNCFRPSGTRSPGSTR